MNKAKKIICISVISAAVLIAFCLITVKNRTYHCEDSSWNESTSAVSVITEKDVIFYDGPGTKEALIFYPGGFVDYNCYSQLLKTIASNGIDCFSVRMPMNFAFFGINRAKKLLSSYSYDSWYIGGHSLGGVAASKFAVKNSLKLDAVILFASYSIDSLADKGLKVLSVLGSNDCVLNRLEYEKRKEMLPSDFCELEIKGANHCQFGNYGFQTGDGLATISSQQQADITADFIRRNLP